MSTLTLFRGLLGLEHTAIEKVRFAADGSLVIGVRPMAKQRSRCGRCRRRCPGYDAGAGRRRWRSLDHGTAVTYLEAAAPRVACAVHGVVVAHVPWAAHGAGHTHTFDAQVAWLAVRTSRSAVTELMRIAWRTVGTIIARVWDSLEARHGDRLDGLRRIGIDEISYKRGHKYLTVVVDHDTGRLVWAAPGRDRDTLRSFFDALGEERCAAISHVSADGADWIRAVVAQRCPAAVQCADPFHVVRWATEALDEVRRQAWNTARRGGATRPNGRSHGRAARTATGEAQMFKRARWALWKNPENLRESQRAVLEWVAKTDPRLHEGYLLKEGLRLVFKMPHHDAVPALERWMTWAQRSQIEPFVVLARRIEKHRTPILAAIEHGLSNGRIESVNTKIRLITRIAFGFHSPHALIALAMLKLGGHPPLLPGRL